MSYTKREFFDEMGQPYAEVTQDNDPAYQHWLDDREREAQDNLEQLFEELEGRNETAG